MNNSPQTDEEGYRFLLPKRSQPFERFITSRCTVEVVPGELRVLETFGPLKREQGYFWDSETRLSIIEQRTPQGSSPQFALAAIFPDRTVLIGAGYPREKLEELLQHLRSAQAEWAGYVPPVPAPVPASREQAAAPLASPHQTPATPGREIQFHPTPTGVQITVPPAGLRKGTHGLWPAVVLAAVVFGIALVSTAGVKIAGGTIDWSGVLPVLLPFVAVFTLLALPLLNMGTRSATLEVDGDFLRIEQRSFFGVKHTRFPRSNVSDVAAENSDLQINGKFVQELRISVHGKKVQGLLTERTEDEIEKVAQALMAALLTTDAG